MGLDVRTVAGGEGPGVLKIGVGSLMVEVGTPEGRLM